MSDTAPALLRVLSFNAGLLRVRTLGGLTCFSNPPHVSSRATALPAALLGVDADVLALQEVYEDDHVAALTAALGSTFPYTARVSPSLAPWMVHNGLIILSRYPLRNVELRRHAKAAWLEHAMGCKAILSATVDSPLGAVFVVNTHLTAGGTASPDMHVKGRKDYTQVDAIREAELAEIEEIASNFVAAACSAAVLVVGDLNAGPEVSRANYTYLLERGFTDPLAAATTATWDPQNPLNKHGPHSSCPPQRCDHIFYHSESMRLTVLNYAVVLQEATVPLADGSRVSVSDHYGVLVDFGAAQL